ncbi:hypothetical protein [Mycobacterium sp. OAE908]|uniref:hypothetical protein n=1 Tax=Mycobacterium sp. OAE908 TaxID=2817899 RepID=UPI001AE47498
MTCGQRGRRLLRTVAASCAVAVVAGCHSGTPGQPAPPPPPSGPWTGTMAQVRVVWSAEPGVDLLTGPAVVVRAFQESGTGVTFGGSEDFLYPGYAHVLPPPGTPPPAPHYPHNPRANIHPLVGTDRYHILRIEPSGANLVAVYCGWFYGVADDLGDGRYGTDDPNRRPTDTVGVFRLALTPPPPGSAPLPPQKGPAPAPVDDVFGGWKITESMAAAAYLHGPPPQWPTMVDDTNQCQAKAPDTREHRLFLSAGVHPRSDYPTLPAFPGWPAGSAQ